ncbi:hypothetical protein DPEC_G00174950 [Dallia pectoralis]|uniref:Uncharacterized protein n=1 Tax=Dallia pectoralis TaxID=75939 RepID=A0ACC2GEL7_DALPE|nr:hypothetical protein DPEC_G00174950 [Dallia pectoralis]
MGSTPTIGVPKHRPSGQPRQGAPLLTGPATKTSKGLGTYAGALVRGTCTGTLVQGAGTGGTGLRTGIGSSGLGAQDLVCGLVFHPTERMTVVVLMVLPRPQGSTGLAAWHNLSPSYRPQSPPTKISCMRSLLGVPLGLCS